jgi:hypothetical protein
MSQQKRDSIKPQFADGQRPSGDDFANLVDSCVNIVDDGVSFDGDQNMVLLRGIRLGDSAGTVAGGLRFNSNQLQVFANGAWTSVAAGAGGGFQAPPTTPQTPVARDGLVGIGTFTVAPTFRLEVPLLANDGPGNQVRFGNAVCCNGAGLANQTFAVFGHQNNTTTALVNTNFALRQAPTGEVQLNAAAGQNVSIRQGGISVRLGISAAGNVIVGGQTDLAGAGTAILHVGGSAFKNDGSANWTFTSDARVKEDVKDLELGLAELRQVRPVRYRYNGRAGTPAGLAGVGVLGQEIESIVPETVRQVQTGGNGEPGLDNLRVFDPSALTYVLINAVKELAAKVERLEEALAAARAQAQPGPATA